MGHSEVVILALLFLSTVFRDEAQASDLSPNDSALGNGDSSINFQPSLAVVIGVLSVMFGLTFVLLMYAKFCHTRPAAIHVGDRNFPGILGRSRRFSGIDKTVIESLPFFRFSSLKGSRQGLECAVCLSKFEDIETLRLLPVCKHAFHINCIDQWLEKHSSCPLCRQKINPEDPAIFAYTNSTRFSANESDRREGSNLELYVQREEAPRGPSRFSLGSSFREIGTSEKEDEIPIQHHDHGVDNETDEEKVLHKLKHQIVVSDVVFKNRWSNVSSSDLIFLNSELLNDMSSNRFSSLEANEERFSTPSRAIENEEVMNKIKEERERKRSFESNVRPVLVPYLPSPSDAKANFSSNTAGIVNPERRSMSEITVLLRSPGTVTSNTTSGREERRRRLWLPIARRTAEWYANREKRSQQKLQSATQNQDVV